ncbi:TonB-dependent receptor [Parvibaculum lavamentivorans DS-1]|uniref:TonB-dependent receptor n=1 Tax=Parvibaculum lavamentivorans (strain DS-1 / DSM 13023 / NCIMB 13966) TaxID=402881 RepID=A7HUB5_PARL1|nr:TonB-dependent receptor [Parvibaculum lavamentivorans]ABS63498.1 TonB-dependent receptor [Parvibaculum lavamentivorans DS-1]
MIDFRFAAGLLAIPLLASAGPAAAQQPETPETVTTGEAGEQPPRVWGLDQITVTTTGLGTPRATHTGNIAKISGDDVDFIAPVQPAEALNRLPGVGIQQGSGAEHLTAIRSPVLSGGAGAGSFLYLEDGVPMRAAGFANVNALMEAMDEVSGGIEVVRGPGGARYGSNAEHGLINFLSRPPAPDSDAELSAWAGPHDLFKIAGTASKTLRGEGLATHGFRGSFSTLHDGGFRASSGLDQQKARLRYDFETPETRMQATLTAVNVNQETAGFVVGPDAYKNPALYKTNPDPDAYRDAWAVRAAVRIERDLADDLMLVLTPYARKNDMNFLMHFMPGTPVEENAHWSGGLLSSLVKDLDDGHRLIFGFDSEYTDGTLTEFQEGPTVGISPQGLHYDYTVKALVLAPYLHSEWRLSPATLFTAGVRFEYTRYDYTNHAPNGTFGRFLRIPSRVDEFADVTPKFGVLHKFNDAITGYVNIARGSRAPQTTDLYRLQQFQVPGEAKSEELDSIEIGARGEWMGVSYETNLFYMEKSNFYFRDANGFNVSDGKTDHAGIEAEIAAPLGAGFDIAAAATYARHTYAFDNFISPTSTETIRDGDDVDTAPRTLANVRLGYVFNEGAGRAEIEWVHMGAYWMDAANTAKYDGHDIFNIRLDYTLTEHLALFGKVTNVFDTRYADRADFAFGNERYFPGEDRGLILGASLRF